MKATFSFDEMIYNQTFKGVVIYDDDDNPQVIDYIKIDKKTRQIIVSCVSGDVLTTHQDDSQSFEVNNKLEFKKPNKRLRSKN